MLTSLLAALRSVPRLVAALERLADAGTVIAAQHRKDEKDKVVDDLIALALSKRMPKDEAKRVEDPSGSQSDGI